jgi:hypothetical protein
MTREETRKEILELLARGKITIDEAVALLDQTSGTVPASGSEADAEPLKVDIAGGSEGQKETVLKPETGLDIEEIASPVENKPVREPRWLRIQVSALDSGKSKVNVNVPFGMVKWGLGMAQLFAPVELGENLDQISAMMAEADAGLLVDVMDEDSNDHVRIYVE